MTKEELYGIIALDESFRIERTTSTSNMDKFQEAICAFANDLPGCRKKGYLLIGVTDKGEISGLKVDDALMKRISAIRSDGNILPLPIMNTEKVHTEQGDVLVVEVTPSFDTPVRYRGRTFVRGLAEILPPRKKNGFCRKDVPQVYLPLTLIHAARQVLTTYMQILLQRNICLKPLMLMYCQMTSVH